MFGWHSQESWILCSCVLAWFFICNSCFVWKLLIPSGHVSICLAGLFLKLRENELRVSWYYELNDKSLMEIADDFCVLWDGDMRTSCAKVDVHSYRHLDGLWFCCRIMRRLIGRTLCPVGWSVEDWSRCRIIFAVCREVKITVLPRSHDWLRKSDFG